MRKSINSSVAYDDNIKKTANSAQNIRTNSIVRVVIELANVILNERRKSKHNIKSKTITNKLEIEANRMKLKNENCKPEKA